MESVGAGGSGGSMAEGGGLELFPVNFTAYRHHEDLETDRHVDAVAELLAPYGVHTAPWTVPPGERDRQAVESRLGAWKKPVRTGTNTVLYWVGHGSADHLAHHRTPTPIDDGATPYDIARAIADRQHHPANAASWAMVVLDSCFSESFARAVHLELFTRHHGAGRYLLLSTAAHGYADLGAFTCALDRVLHVTFPTRRAIGLSALGRELAGELCGFFDDLTIDDHRDQLVRLTPNAATAVSAPLDQIAELQDVIDQLPADEQRHFLPKATGAELGELAWYFHGRTDQRDQILHWLTAAAGGSLVVTGPAGAGKSALLGHVLLHTNTRLREILIRHGHLQPLPAQIPCPDDPFDLAVHLAGLTPARTLHLIARTAGLADIAQQAAGGQPPADLVGRLIAELRGRQRSLTLLFDALDEAEQPLVIADQILRPLAALPTVRLVIGTRRSTREGPDQPATADTDILDALHPATPNGPAASGPRYVEVSRDPEALAGYLRAKLHAAKHRGTVHADYGLIDEAVRRLVADRRQEGGEPQQFLYARLAAHELLNDPHLITDPSPLIGRTHRQLFSRALARLHRVDPRYTPLLRALGLAQGRGLPEQDGIWATAADALSAGATDTREAIPDLLRDAAPYLALDQAHGQSVYRLAHRTFTEHFTTTPGTDQDHAHVTTALARHARSALRRRGTPDSASRLPEVSPYIRHHLAAHACLGHTAEALRILDGHPDVLDTLHLGSITTNLLQHGLMTKDLPPAIAGTVLHQHQVRDTAAEQQPGATTGWRRWWRRLGTTYIQGTPPPAETHADDTRPWPPTLIAGTVQPRRLHLQLTGHTGEVWAVAAFTAPDGTARIVSADHDDGAVRIWDPSAGRQVGEPLTGHTGSVFAVVAFAGLDGAPRVVTGGEDRTVRIWDPVAGSQIGEALTGHTDWVRAVAVYPGLDGAPRVATGGEDRTVRIWDPATGAQLGEALTGHTGSVSRMAAFAVPGGGPRLATVSSFGRTVRIWDPVTGSQVGELPTGHAGWVDAMAGFTTPEGAPHLVTCDNEGTARIWDLVTGSRLRELRTGHARSVHAMTGFTAPDGTLRLATSGDNWTVEVRDPVTGSVVGEVLAGHTGTVRAVVAFAAPDGTTLLATGGDDRTVRIWNPVAGTAVRRSRTGHDGWVPSLAAFTGPDGTLRVVIGGGDKTVRICDPATGRQIGETLTGHSEWVWAVAVFTTPDGALRIASAGDYQTVRIWDPATGAQVGEPLTGNRHWVTGLAVFDAPDGTSRLATAGGDGTVRIWNPTTGRRVGKPFTGHTTWVSEVAAFTAPDGTPRLASSSRDGTVRIWDPVAGRQIGEPLTGHTDSVNVVTAFTAPDGATLLATGGEDRTVRIWDPVAGRQIGEPLTGHTDSVNVMAAFTAPDGTPRLVSAGGDDETVRLWNPLARTGQILPLADRVHSLTVALGLLVVGTASGYLTLDLSSVPVDAG